MQIRAVVIIAIQFMLLGLTPSSAAQSSLRFNKYKVPVYTGRIHPPKGIRHVIGNEWLDDLGKPLDPPAVNFAGKYSISFDCGGGTQCHYFTITDLSSGRTLNLLKDFQFAEPLPKTDDRHLHLIQFTTRPESKLLILQYYVELGEGDECRERAFVLNGERLRPITATRRGCRHY
jgi:hypothetical protein